MQAPRGCPDILPQEVKKRLFILNATRQLVQKYGFQEYETPIFEHSEVFEKNLGETSDIVSKEMYSFTDKGGEQFTLRPEATASIARLFISQKLGRELPLKVFYQGPMFRHERPQKGRQRQFTQMGIENLGIKDPKFDAEAISLGWGLLKRLNIDSGAKVLINSLGTLDDREKYKKDLVVYLKKRSVELSEDSQRRLESNPLRILDSKSENDQKILLEAPSILDYLNAESATEFESVKSILKALEVPFEVAPLLVRGLDYYNDVVFEIVHDQLGAQSAVLAGGRYDSMVENMGGPVTPGFGWACGLERLSLLVEHTFHEELKVGIVDIQHANDEYLMKINQILFEKVETYWSPTGNFSKQMKKCENQGCSYVVLFGEDEINTNHVQVKNLRTGEQTSVALADLRDHNFLK